MALWGNKDSKTASGTVVISSAGAVTGSSTAFTTQAKVGDYIRVASEDYLITAIASNTAATVVAGVPGATFTGNTSRTLLNINAASDIFVAFVSYFPLNKKDTLDNAFDKGPMDLYTSGVYELREIEHRFQQGQYVSKLRMYRDHKSSTYFLQEELKNL